MDREELHKETIKYIREASLEHRKKLGQYFTPRTLREILFNKLPKIKKPRILDPAAGTGEFLITAKKYYPDSQVYGREIDLALVNISRRVAPYAHIEQANFLRKYERKNFDFIIGNPPYFEFKPDPEIRKKYSEILNGRVNIYGIFIYKAIQLLKNGGYLAFIVPPSMNNGAYFAKLRNFIIANCNIEFLSVQQAPTLFNDALQSVMLLILKKGPSAGNYIFKKNGITIFSEEKEYLENIFKTSVTLSDLGYRVKTGKLVWNQNKDLLTDIRKGSVPLIWSHNITKKGIKLNNHRNKPQFAKTNLYEQGPVIVTNRIIGQPHKGSLRAAVVPKGMKFIAENHVNVIYPPDKQIRINFVNKETSIGSLVKQLNSSNNSKILFRLTGNTQISKNELEKLFPVKV
jgi:adenine-specific DNA-methyltransferase